jgi:dihydroorotate dehydrogenase (fumarate)
VGTALVEEGVAVFERLERELMGELSTRGKESLRECRGKLKEL